MSTQLILFTTSFTMYVMTTFSYHKYHISSLTPVLEWEFFSFGILAVPAFWTPIWQTKAFKGTGNLLTDFVSKYENYPAIHASGAQVAKMYNALWRRVVAINFLILPAIACSVVINAHILYGEYLTAEVACLMAAALVINWYLYFIPPSSSGVNYYNLILPH